MARVTETPWPPQPIRVEVSALAGPVGAFTSDDPPRIAIASDDTRADGPAGLEILFHEASHVLDGKIMSIIDAAAAAQHRASPPGLWHAVLFYTAGELVARRLGAGYVPYGIKQGLYERAPGWSDYLRALRDAYTPHLDGKATLDASLQAVVRAVP